MQALTQIYELVLKFLERGGPVMLAIILTSILMWTLIVERYLYLYLSYPGRLSRIAALWRSRPDHNSWYAQRIREKWVSELSVPLQRNLTLISNIIVVLPLLGLLGTVTGMITSFEVLRVFGTDNARGLTAGISEALLATLAGLVTALSGLYFSFHLRKLVNTARMRAQQALRAYQPPVIPIP